VEHRNEKNSFVVKNFEDKFSFLKKTFMKFSMISMRGVSFVSTVAMNPGASSAVEVKLCS